MLALVSQTIPFMLRVVIDTNILISALRSQFGASYAIFKMLGMFYFEFCISVSLAMEYEAIAKRMHRLLGLTLREIDDIIDYMCLEGRTQKIYYLWRPTLPDPSDDMLLELAVASHSTIIVTHNTKHFKGAEAFGVRAMKPNDFLRLLEKNK